MPAETAAPEVLAEEIRAQRDRILASKVFSRSKRQCDFLSYIVDAALAGRADCLKELTLGIDVFGKDASYDPGTDSIVRVEASRLRSKLREYYLEEGGNDALRIEVPKGHYVPLFTAAAPVDDQPEVAPTVESSTTKPTRAAVAILVDRVGGRRTGRFGVLCRQSEANS